MRFDEHIPTVSADLRQESNSGQECAAVSSAAACGCAKQQADHSAAAQAGVAGESAPCAAEPTAAAHSMCAPAQAAPLGSQMATQAAAPPAGILDIADFDSALFATQGVATQRQAAPAACDAAASSPALALHLEYEPSFGFQWFATQADAQEAPGSSRCLADTQLFPCAGCSEALANQPETASVSPASLTLAVQQQALCTDADSTQNDPSCQLCAIPQCTDQLDCDASHTAGSPAAASPPGASAQAPALPRTVDQPSAQACSPAAEAPQPAAHAARKRKAAEPASPGLSERALRKAQARLQQLGGARAVKLPPPRVLLEVCSRIS